MKRFVAVVMVVTLVIGMSFSVQAQARHGKRNAEKSEMKQGERKMISTEKRVEMIAKQLELSDAEKIKVQALFEKQEGRAKLYREEMKKVREEHLAKIKAERNANEAELIRIIGNEKYQQLQSQRIARLERENRMLKMRNDQPAERRKKMMEKNEKARK